MFNLFKYGDNKTDSFLSFCVWLITCPLYWTGRLVIWCILGKRAEFEKAGVTDNFAEESFRDADCCRRGKRFVTDTTSIIAGVGVVTLLGVLAAVYFNHHPLSEKSTEAIRLFFRRLYGVHD